jgi:hypothetical protein
MDARIIELAIEALRSRRSGVEAEIAMLEGELRGRPPLPASPVAGKRRPRTAAQRKAHSERMRTYWAARKGRAIKAGPARKTASAKPKLGPQSAAARKAQSERMKAYWAKRKAAAAKKPKTAKAGTGPKAAGSSPKNVPF